MSETIPNAKRKVVPIELVAPQFNGVMPPTWPAYKTEVERLQMHKHKLFNLTQSNDESDSDVESDHQSKIQAKPSKTTDQAGANRSETDEDHLDSDDDDEEKEKKEDVGKQVREIKYLILLLSCH
jgi:hypothetical protein